MRLVTGSLAAALVAIAACGPSSPAKDPASNVNAKNVSTTEGVVVTAGCTPTGPELCFNAIDDNCNGVIDEGCGVGTGVLQFTVAWGDSPADVDLVVTDPNGGRVYEGNRNAPSGLRLDKDCPGDDGCHGQNIENVFLDGLDPPKGKYQVEVRLTELRGAETPVKVRLGARVGSRTFGAELLLKPGSDKSGDDKKSFTFEL